VEVIYLGTTLSGNLRVNIVLEVASAAFKDDIFQPDVKVPKATSGLLMLW